MRAVFALAALAALSFGGSRAEAATGCSAQLQQAMIANRTAPQPESDLNLYTEFYRCLGRPEDEARGLAALRVQLAEAGEAYVDGRLSPPLYRAFIIDRQRKAERMRDTAGYAGAVAAGDADGDLVPDSADRCKGTAPFTATDEQGCDIKCADLDPLAKPDPVCLAAAPPNSAEDPIGPVVEAPVPINLACGDEIPAASEPIDWGARRTVVTNNMPFPREVIDTTTGYYFRLQRSSPQAEGCEYWYMLQFAFRRPSDPSLPAIEVVSVLFSNKEDETAGDALARFRIMTHHSQIQGDLLTIDDDLPLSWGRRRLRNALAKYAELAVRVRVVTGGQQASPWSAYQPRSKGPEIRD